MQTYKVTVDDQGTIRWYDQEDKLHREDGPAVEHVDGYKAWYWHGKWHREDGPAIEYADGDKLWFWHGQCHREDGPALEYTDGTKIWYVHNERHREDGPAYEGFDGHKVWYLHDKLFVDEEDWEQAKQAKVSSPSCEGKVVEIEGKKYKLTLL